MESIKKKDSAKKVLSRDSLQSNSTASAAGPTAWGKKCNLEMKTFGRCRLCRFSVERT